METTKVKTTWAIDPTHSELTFKVKHLMITNVKGEFRQFNVSLESDGNNFANAKVIATANADSIDTNNTDRDNHLKSADFFDATAHKQLKFEGITVKKSDEIYQLIGGLTIKGKTNQVVFDVEFGGLVTDPYGNKKAGFSFSGKINRKDWGLNWNAALETGGVMVSEEVRIYGEAQFVREK